MMDSSLGRKKRTINYAASPQGIEKAERALKRLGFESKSNFAKSQLLSRSTVTRFLQGHPIQLDSLKRICEALTLDWQEIVQTCEEEQARRLEINQPSHSDTSEGVKQMQKLSRKVTVLDKQSQTIKAVIILEGDFNSINNDLSVSLPAILQAYGGDTIKITDIREGSIRLTIEGSPEDIEQLRSRFNSKELTKLNGFPVEDVQILSESSDEDDNNEPNDKWRLVQEISSQRVFPGNLSGVDLSDADLSDADLSGTNLSGTDLCDADLIDTNLSCADLSHADLISTNLSGANLSRANLSFADLSFADLNGADLSGADLSFAILFATNLSDAFLTDAFLTDAFLTYANLSGADLRLADLVDTKLKAANLSGADLSGANLRSADLSRADLSGVNLRDANLIGANLRDANLIGANFKDAVVEKAQFRDSSGLTEETILDLERRGAIFDDSPGDRSGVLSRR